MECGSIWRSRSGSMEYLNSCQRKSRWSSTPSTTRSSPKRSETQICMLLIINTPHQIQYLTYHICKTSFSEVFLPVEQRIDGCPHKEEDGCCNQSYLIQEWPELEDVQDEYSCDGQRGEDPEKVGDSLCETVRHMHQRFTDVLYGIDDETSHHETYDVPGGVFPADFWLAAFGHILEGSEEPFSRQDEDNSEEGSDDQGGMGIGRVDECLQTYQYAKVDEEYPLQDCPGVRENGVYADGGPSDE